MIELAIFYLACLLVFAWLWLTAPDGWEDASGFHLGPEPFHNDGRELPDGARFTAAPFHHDSGVAQS